MITVFLKRGGRWHRSVPVREGEKQASQAACLLNERTPSRKAKISNWLHDPRVSRLRGADSTV